MVPALVLAAGASSRMGRPKPLLPLGDRGDTFLSRILKTLHEADVDDLLVVVGHDGASIRTSLKSFDFPVRVIENPDYSKGQLSSLQAGLLAADRPGVRGVLVTLVDLPLVSSATVRAVLDAYSRHPNVAMVRPVSGHRHGHPVVFDRQLFDELRAGDPSVGAKPIVHAHREQILGVPVTDEGAFVDIDTPADYERFIGKLKD